jgi:hypothetical protein
MSDTKKHYVNNTDLLNAIVGWQAACKVAIKEGRETPIIPDYVGKCIIEICTRLSFRYNFNKYTYRDEMVSDGIESCINAVKNFNIEKTDRAFSYMTMVAFRAFQRRILSERKQQYIKHKNYQHSFMAHNLEEDVADNEYNNKVISEYEEKMLTKAKKPAIVPKPNTMVTKRKQNG